MKDEDEDERYLCCWRWETVERLENDGSRSVQLCYFAFVKTEFLRLWNHLTHGHTGKTHRVIPVMSISRTMSRVVELIIVMFKRVNRVNLWPLWGRTRTERQRHTAQFCLSVSKIGIWVLVSGRRIYIFLSHSVFRVEICIIVSVRVVYVIWAWSPP